MKIKILMIIIFLANLTLKGQHEKERNNPIEIKLKVWQETEGDYKRFIKKQAQIRKKLDKYMEAQDVEKLNLLKLTYDAEIEESEKKGGLIPSIGQGENIALFTEVWKRMNDRFRHQIRAHEIINPILLGRQELYEVAEYLSEKYGEQIEPIQKKIGKAYQKLRKKERKIYLKYREEKKREKANERTVHSYQMVTQTSKKSKVFGHTKILLVESKK